MFFNRIFKYFEPAWTGTDGKISLRAALAIAFSIDFIRNLSHAIYKWEAGRSLEGLSLTLGIEAGLIVALLGLTTYQNLQFGKHVVDASVKEAENIRKEEQDEITRVEGKKPQMVD